MELDLRLIDLRSISAREKITLTALYVLITVPVILLVLVILVDVLHHYWLKNVKSI